MTDFKVGDEVEVINIYGGTSDNRVGAKGPITEVRAGGTAFYVHVKNKENYRFGATLVFYPDELKLVQPAPKFKVGDIVESVGFQYEAFKGKTLIVDHLNEGDTYPYAVRALGEDYEKGHNFREDELLDYRSPKSDTYGLSAKDEAWAQANKKGEAVKHPAHYGGGDNPYEAIKVIEAWGLGFNLGNAAKYLARAGKKGNKVEDLNKLIQYVQFEIAKEEAK